MDIQINLPRFLQPHQYFFVKPFFPRNGWFRRRNCVYLLQKYRCFSAQNVIFRRTASGQPCFKIAAIQPFGKLVYRSIVRCIEYIRHRHADPVFECCLQHCIFRPLAFQLNCRRNPQQTISAILQCHTVFLIRRHSFAHGNNLCKSIPKLSKQLISVHMLTFNGFYPRYSRTYAPAMASSTPRSSSILNRV